MEALLFDLEQVPHAEKIYKMAAKLRRPLPTVFAQAPVVHPWLTLFQKAFWDLISDRTSPDTPIHWMVRQKWAEVHGLDETASELLHTHVKAQDVAFLTYIQNERSKGKGSS